MKDKDFDKLLSKTLNEYGPEYQHGADVPDIMRPVPVHKFPDDFLSDIETGAPQKKKKSPFAALRIVSAAAAVFVIGLALVIVPQIVNRPSNIADTSEKMPWESAVSESKSDKALPSSKSETSKDKSINDNIEYHAGETSMTSIPSEQAAYNPISDTTHSDKDVSTTSVPSQLAEVSETPSQYDPVYEHETSEYDNTKQSETTDKPQESDNTPPVSAATSVVDPDYAVTDPDKPELLPEEISYSLMFKGQPAVISREELNVLALPLNGIIDEDNAWYETPYIEPIALAELEITCDDPEKKLLLGSKSLDSVKVTVYNDMLFVTAVSGGKTEYYCTDDSEPNTAFFYTALAEFMM